MIELKAVPLAYLGFGASVLLADVADIAPTTAAGALIGGFTLLLGTLCWVVREQFKANQKQSETFAAALKEQQATFTDTLERQNTVFATVCDRIREDNQKTLKIMKETQHGRPDA